MRNSSVFERILREEMRTKLDQYFGTLKDLDDGNPVFQLHTTMSENGLGKAVRKTKASQLADMTVGEEYFFKAPGTTSVKVWAGRWNGIARYMTKKTGYRWSVRRDRENGGIVVSRVS